MFLERLTENQKYALRTRMHTAVGFYYDPREFSVDIKYNENENCFYVATPSVGGADPVILSKFDDFNVVNFVTPNSLGYVDVNGIKYNLDTINKALCREMYEFFGDEYGKAYEENCISKCQEKFENAKAEGDRRKFREVKRECKKDLEELEEIKKRCFQERYFLGKYKELEA